MAHARDPTTRVRREERYVEDYPEHEHVSPGASFALTLQRLIYAIFGALEVLVLVRFVLKLGNANPGMASPGLGAAMGATSNAPCGVSRAPPRNS